MTDETNPLATYRFQFNPDFRFEDARRLVGYLRRLGVTHLYSSPLLRPRKGSTHGYDVVDPASLNPELGTNADFDALVATLHESGLGLILDIVPNHMAAGQENPYWEDVLKYGPDSPYARWFDIDFRLPDPQLWGRVLVPVLGDTLQAILQQGELRLVISDREFRVKYWEQSFPVTPATVPDVLSFAVRFLEDRLPGGDALFGRLQSISRELSELPQQPGRSRRNDEPIHEQAKQPMQQLAELFGEHRDHMAAAAEAFGDGAEGHHRLRSLLDGQCYRLAYWRRAARILNYRRFFDINDLIAVRQEDPQVFDETHEAVVRWTREGKIDGLRIDHVDGLRDPEGYFERLAAAVSDPGDASRQCPIFVEKILAPDEQLRESWPVTGTTGYESLNRIESIFLSTSGHHELELFYRQLRRRPVRFKNVVYWAKRRVLRAELSAFVGQLARILARAAQRFPETVGLTYPEMVEAIVEVVVCLPIYRTYVGDREAELHPEDRRFLETALAGARWRQRAMPEALDFLAEVLLLKGFADLPENEKQERLSFLQRFQQLTGPAAAKGVEDTALYAYVPLVSRNEVGSEPDTPLDRAIADLHEANRTNAQRWPRIMHCVTTHDTKRTADVRSRLDVLSELPRLWAGHVQRWRRLNRPHRNRVGGRLAPDTNTEYLLYQTIVGIWPAPPPEPELSMPEAETIGELRDRVEEYMLKATREMKTRTSWVNPSEDYEEALVTFVRSLFFPVVEPWSEFLLNVNYFVSRIARPGFWNALSRALIQFTVPGTPDLYQGDELWNYALVDPDNRRPVDFELRQRLLDDIQSPGETTPDSVGWLLREMIDQAEDGRIKLYVVHRALQMRREMPELFVRGTYEPLEAQGSAGEHVFTFLRRTPEHAMLVVVPRLAATLLVDEYIEPPMGKEIWGETSISLPDALENATWRSAFDGVSLAASGGKLQLADVFKDFPLGLLVAELPGAP